MVELDGDDIRISSRGKLAERDIVQVTALHSMKESLPELPETQTQEWGQSSQSFKE